MNETGLMGDSVEGHQFACKHFSNIIFMDVTPLFSEIGKFYSKMFLVMHIYQFEGCCEMLVEDCV